MFEFCDHPRTPASIRLTLLELLHFCNRKLRGYYQRVAEQILVDCRAYGLTTVVELGAGTAPITRELAAGSRSSKLTLVPCDLYPEHRAWESLRRAHGECVQPIDEPVDFLESRSWPHRSVLVLVAAFHHIAPSDRGRFLDHSCRPGTSVMIFEPLRKSYLSMLLTVFAFLPAVLLPLTMIFQQGSMRRMLWCWLIPVVPIMFLWDGWVSCLRQWSMYQWELELRARLPAKAIWKIDAGLHSHSASWHWPAKRSSNDGSKRVYEST